MNSFQIETLHYYGTKPGHFDTLNHSLSRERCERRSERTSEWSSIAVLSVFLAVLDHCVAMVLTKPRQAEEHRPMKGPVRMTHILQSVEGCSRGVLSTKTLRHHIALRLLQLLLMILSMMLWLMLIMLLLLLLMLITLLTLSLLVRHAENA